MANLLRWEAPSTYSGGNLADATAMASRATGYYSPAQVSAADVVIDNAANKHKYLTIEASLASIAFVLTDYMNFYLLYAYDGTNYESGSTTLLPTADHLWRRTGFGAAATSARRFGVTGLILPYKFKVLWETKIAATLAGSGSTLSYQTFGDNLNG